jgi:hypothetical protein
LSPCLSPSMSPFNSKRAKTEIWSRETTSAWVLWAGSWVC